MSRKLYQPRTKKPTAQQKRELKAFKLDVDLGAHSALTAMTFDKELRGLEVKIGNMECLFYPYDQKAIRKQISKFKTTRW